MTSQMKQERQELAFGPVRFRRKAMGIAYPLLASWVMVPDVGWNGFAVGIPIAGLLFARAASMRVSCDDDRVYLKNWLWSHIVPREAVDHVSFSKPLAPGMASLLSITTRTGKLYKAGGVSVWSDIFGGTASFASRRSRASIESTKAFFQGCVTSSSASSAGVQECGCCDKFQGDKFQGDEFQAAALPTRALVTPPNVLPPCCGGFPPFAAWGSDGPFFAFGCHA